MPVFNSLFQNFFVDLANNQDFALVGPLDPGDLVRRIELMVWNVDGSDTTMGYNLFANDVAPANVAQAVTGRSLIRRRAVAAGGGSMIIPTGIGARSPLTLFPGFVGGSDAARWLSVHLFEGGGNTLGVSVAVEIELFHK